MENLNSNLNTNIVGEFLNNLSSSSEDKFVEAKHFRKLALILGLISPALIVLNYLILIVSTQLSNGYYGSKFNSFLGLTLFCLLFVSIVLGIIAMNYGSKALNLMRKEDTEENLPKNLYFAAIVLGVLNIVVPLFVFLLLI